jgi:hypothetical protein
VTASSVSVWVVTEYRVVLAVVVIVCVMVEVEPDEFEEAQVPPPELTRRNTAEVLPEYPGLLTDASITSGQPTPMFGTGKCAE